MAYISKEKSAGFRKALKAAFPGWKFSVRIDHHSSLEVQIISAPYDLLQYRNPDRWSPECFDRKHCQVNQYHMNGWNGRALDDLKKIIAICNEGNHDNSDIMSDYFDVGWYFNLSIGDWDKPFEVK